MAGLADAPSTDPSRRSSTTDLAIVGGAVAVAVVAGVAAGMGVTRAQPLVGVVAVLGIAYAWSTDRRAIDARTVAWGLGLQIVFALVVLKTALGQQTFTVLGDWMTRLLGFAFVGAAFVFGPLGDSGQWQAIAQVLGPAASSLPVAFQVVPTIIFVAALSAVLYYFGIMQIVVRLFALLMRRVIEDIDYKGTLIEAGKTVRKERRLLRTRARRQRPGATLQRFRRASRAF
jgi:CNT family concentrative nucleoside transporter